jgi:hypothetical protein
MSQSFSVTPAAIRGVTRKVTNPAEVVVREVQRDRRDVVFDLLPKSQWAGVRASMWCQSFDETVGILVSLSAGPAHLSGFVGAFVRFDGGRFALPDIILPCRIRRLIPFVGFVGLSQEERHPEKS